jgi:hypothetical protein
MSDKMGRTVRGNIDWTKLKKIKVTHKDNEFQYKLYRTNEFDKRNF